MLCYGKLRLGEGLIHACLITYYVGKELNKIPIKETLR